MTIKSDSDYVAGALANYTSGIGYYTSHTEVSDLLQVGAFTNSSTPSIATVGKIIKRVEGRIDESIKLSYRPEIIEKETHNFDAWQLQSYPLTYWKDYVGFIQLNSTKIQKIIRLEVYKGDAYEDLASAMVEYTPPADAVNGAFTITLGVGSDADTGYRFVLTKGQANVDLVHTAEIYLTLRSPKEVYANAKPTKIINGEAPHGSNINIPADKYHRETFFVSVHTRNLAKHVAISEQTGTSIGESSSYNK